MEPYLTILREQGYKITPLRKAILSVFQKERSSLTAEKLTKMIRTRIPNAGLQSVYRNLSDFTKLGITEEVFLERRKAAYALCNGVSTHHHHAVCRRCGRTVEVTACELGRVSEQLDRSLDHIRKKNRVFSGSSFFSTRRPLP